MMEIHSAMYAQGFNDAQIAEAINDMLDGRGVQGRAN
jgi:hypothetical protein